MISALEEFNCANTKHMFFTIVFHKQRMQSDYRLRGLFSLGSVSQLRDGTFMIIVVIAEMTTHLVAHFYARVTRK